MLARVHRLITALLATICLLLVTAPPAQASPSAENTGLVHSSDFLCVSVRSYLANLSEVDNGYHQTVDVTALVSGPLSYCQMWRTLPAGYLAVNMQLFYYTGAQWLYCTGLDGWLYTSVPSAGADANWWTGPGSNPAPCGTAWYATIGGGLAYNGLWYGGWLPSGNVFMVWRSGLRAESAPQPAPPRPPWITENGWLDLAKLPAEMASGGPDGSLLRTADGAVVTFDPRELFALPTRPPGQNPPTIIPPNVRFTTW